MEFNLIKMLTPIEQDLKEKQIIVTFGEGTLKSTFFTVEPVTGSPG